MLVNQLRAHYNGYNFASYVMNAFPDVNFRYVIIPRKPLSPTWVFTEGAISYLIDVGSEDGTFYAKQGPSGEMSQKVHDISKESRRIVNAD
jgi:hypothetical protein|mmetsp:Transcript_19625/g.3216  ORF Transcript_19625/g.3216 Transcript_19625/m.3216 type:complete len:91 (-) Transcript_19625:1870-2142(-)